MSMFGLGFVTAMNAMGHAALTVTNTASATDAADATTHTYSSQSIGAAATDRYIVVGASARSGTSGRTITDVTIGGVPAMQLIQRSGDGSGSNIVGLYILNVPAGTTADIVVTYSGSVNRGAIVVSRVIGTVSTLPHDTASDGAGDPLFATIDILAGGVGIAMQYGGINSATTWTGLANDVDIPMEGFNRSSGAWEAFAAAQAGLTVQANHDGVGEEVFALISLAIKVPSAPETAWSKTLNTDTGDNTGWSQRNILSAASIAASGNQCRITLVASTGGNMTIDNAAIVERSGSTVNGVTTPTEILFSGGSGVALTSGETAVSDWLSFNIDETKEYLIILDVGANGFLRKTDSGGDGTYEKGSTNSYNVRDPSGFSFTSNKQMAVSLLEVQTV